MLVQVSGALKYIQYDIQYDIKCEDDLLILKFKLSGYGANDIAVSSEFGNCVKVKSKKRNEDWTKSIPINTLYDISKLTAKMKYGMLTISIPLSEEYKSVEYNIIED